MSNDWIPGTRMTPREFEAALREQMGISRKHAKLAVKAAVSAQTEENMSASPEQVEKLRNEIVEVFEKRNKQISELQSKVNAMAFQMDQIRAEQTAPGEPIGSLSGSTPGSKVTADLEAVAAVKKYGKVQIALEGGFFPIRQAATITSGTVGSATPGVLRPSRDDQLVQLPRRRLTMRDLLGSRPVDSNQVDYVKEKSLPTASPQVEASDKFESNYELEIGSAAIRTFAVWVAASNQVLDDLAELRDWIDQALLYALLVKEEAEILSGDNTGQHLNGLITQATSYAGTYDRSGDNAMDRLRNALAELEAADEQPNFIAVSPVDWRTRIQAVKTENNGANTGRYLAQDPVTRSLIASPTLWGIPVVVSNSLSAGTFLVGDSMQAYIADRMDANVVLSNEHSDYFVKNLVAIRAEERLALVVRRPSAFLTGSLADTSPL